MENTIERAAILCSNDCIDVADVQIETEPLNGSAGNEIISPAQLPAGIKLPDFLDNMEKNFIENAMRDNNYIQAHAADNLGITKSLLQYKMKKYGISKSS